MNCNIVGEFKRRHHQLKHSLKQAVSVLQTTLRAAIMILLMLVGGYELVNADIESSFRQLTAIERSQRKGQFSVMDRNTAERIRLDEESRREKNWKRWGPYLSERQWGTVREDYSPKGDAWEYFPHAHARSRAYRWGEDGLLGITDRQCRLCFGLALWNEQDAILKERLFGLSGPEGNHGEDVKECYYYLDSTPTHSYMKALYKYPHAAFPYDDLIKENKRRSRLDPEYELMDTGVFDENRYFDVMIEYAKAGPNDILIRINVDNRGPDPAKLHLLPTIWFRNTWSWQCTHEGCSPKPMIRLQGDELQTLHTSFESFRFAVSPECEHAYRFLFTDNHTNAPKLFGNTHDGDYYKDAFHDYLIGENSFAVSPKPIGTKVAPHFGLEIDGHGACTIELRLTAESELDGDRFGPNFERIFQNCQREADEFYGTLIPESLNGDEKRVVRQAHAGLLWTKQFYHYVVEDWLEGDPDHPSVPERQSGRNSSWPHLFNRDVISMPDKWEYPWYAAWDLAFHMVPMAELDPEFTKDQLILFLREWYMHPNGQLPAYEWALGDVNPPVHAWACWRCYQLTKRDGVGDRDFLARAFQKLLLNFTWWVNQKDVRGKNVFSGGFLGLDNITMFDRSKPMPNGGFLEQADGTAWVAYFCSSMLSIAFELASKNRVYSDMASKFFEHYVHIAEAINTLDGTGLWDEEDGFYYDHLHCGSESIPLRTRSMVGIIPLFTVDVLYDEVIDRLPGFRKRMDWFLENSELSKHMSCMVPSPTGDGARLIAIPSEERLLRILRYVLDENEFLSPYGIRSLSKVHEKDPFVFEAGTEELRVQYAPGESETAMFGGNSNWRGPVWLPLNYLLIEALRRYHQFYGDTMRVECPTGSGQMMTFGEVATEIETRIIGLFTADEKGHRPLHHGDARYATDEHWKDLVLFYEYFHGDNGSGLGASHQTGWTALVAQLLKRDGSP